MTDTAYGSGSLILKADKILGKDAIRNVFYGQEINITIYNIAESIFFCMTSVLTNLMFPVKIL